MRAQKLIKILDIHGRYPDFEDFEAAGISCNSKEVAKGFIFVAIKGARQDGHRFVEEAISRGAKLIIVHSPQSIVHSQHKAPFIKVKDTRRALARLSIEFYGRPSSKVNVVGVTGTNGKTTVTYLIEALLKKAGKSPAVIGTVNYRFKDKIFPSKNTTPGPIQLQSLLSDMLNEGIDYAVMEVSSHALDQQRTSGIDFHSAIFTNLTQDHLDYHKDLQNYFAAKAKLFQNLDSGAFAVINSDNEFGRRIKRLTNAEVVTYGIINKSGVSAKKIKYSCTGTQFLLSLGKLDIEVKAGLIGAHNVYNILAAAAWGFKSGIAPQVIKSAIAESNCLPGRLERVNSGGRFRVFVDYAHTPDALKNIISALKALAKKRVIVVFGCGGERDKTKRPKMGSIVTRLADYAVITDDNPRSEDPRQIIKDIEKGIRGKNYCIIPERAEAIKKALVLAKTGDIVLIAGKGHEDYQVLKDKVIHFDDREVARGCLKSMS